MQSVLITGVYGLLGQNLVRALVRSGRTVYGMDKLSPSFQLDGLSRYFQADMTEPKSLALIFNACQPDILINTAAVTNVDLCEKERSLAFQVNTEAVGHLLSAAPKARFVQISTDYVFDGKAGPYCDDAPVNPISVYGASKAKAEALTMGYSNDNLVIRTMVLFGKGQSLRPDFITFVRESLSAGKQINIVTDQIGNITLVGNLADNITALLNAESKGIYSLAGSDLLSRFEIARLIAVHDGLAEENIHPIVTASLHQAAKRPLNSGFVMDRARRVPGIELLSFQEQLKRYDAE